jgi:hypothetical protein
MRVKEFYEPMFEATVIFMTETTPMEIDKYLKRRGYIPQGYEEVAGSVTLLDKTDKQGRKTREYLVVVEDKKAFYTLLHETHHLASHIMNDRMIPIGRENDEVASYIQNYWFRTLWRFMNNKVVVLKNK